MIRRRKIFRLGFLVYSVYPICLKSKNLLVFYRINTNLKTLNSESKFKVSDWDRKEIQISSRKVKYLIYNKLSVIKIGTFGILKGADLLEKQGIKFV